MNELALLRQIGAAAGRLGERHHSRRDSTTRSTELANETGGDRSGASQLHSRNP